jgi:hypothetical protein
MPYVRKLWFAVGAGAITLIICAPAEADEGPHLRDMSGPSVIEMLQDMPSLPPDGPTIEAASPSQESGCDMSCEGPAETNPAMDLPEKPIEAPEPVMD